MIRFFSFPAAPLHQPPVPPPLFSTSHVSECRRRGLLSPTEPPTSHPPPGKVPVTHTTAPPTPDGSANRNLSPASCPQLCGHLATATLSDRKTHASRPISRHVRNRHTHLRTVYVPRPRAAWKECVTSTKRRKCMSDKETGLDRTGPLRSRPTAVTCFLLPLRYT